MNIQQLITALELPERGLISIVGGGGKTTLMVTLANHFARLGKKVIITTSTHIFLPTSNDVGELILEEDFKRVTTAFCNTNLVAIGQIDGDKLSSCSLSFLNKLRDYADYVFVEADGSKRLPFKAPTSHEPVIPENTDLVIAVAGLSALGQPISKCCHRPNIVAEIIHKPVTAELCAIDMATILCSPLGQLKNVPSIERYKIILNQADTPWLVQTAHPIADYITQKIGVSCIITSLLNLERMDDYANTH
ncbi:MAG: selenium cofactor biosynthesis protein YqeC [Cellulosilyticaceae bacterium]